VQDFITQAESLIYDESFKDAIIANAKQYIETEHNDADEHEAFSRLSMGMFRSVRRKAVANPGESTDEEERTTRVRFQMDQKKKELTTAVVELGEGDKNAAAVDDGPHPEACEETPAGAEDGRSGDGQTTATSCDEQAKVENASGSKEPEKGDQSESGEGVAGTTEGKVIDPQQSTIPSVDGGIGKTPERTDGEDARTTDNDTAVKPVGMWSNPAVDTSQVVKSPRVVAVKNKSVESASPPNSPRTQPASATGKGAKNGQKQASATAANGSGAKKSPGATSTSGASKKVPLNTTSRVNKAPLKPPSHTSANRSFSDSASMTKPKSSEVSSRPASRQLK